jgi:hypothetical protein
MAVVAGLLTWLGAVCGAQTRPAPPAPSNDDCMTCHGDKESAVRSDNTSVHVDGARYATSLHGQLGLTCVTCHTALATVAEWPHAKTLAPPDCSGCHADAAAQYASSVHGQSRQAGRKVAATCASCHGSHDILPSKDPESRTYHLNLPRTCGQCHGSDATVAAANLPGGNIIRSFEDSIHGRALLRGGLLVAPSCNSCHGAHDVRPKGDPSSRVARANVPRVCGRCHEGVERQFTRGRHGEQLQKDNPRGPVCIDCHSAHHIQMSDLAAWQVDVVRECGTCHQESAATYRDTFHGQVTALGFTRVATCASCHEAHDVRPRSDPASPVNDARIVATCQKCHAGANANFAKYNPHANRHDRDRYPALYAAGRFMDFLLLSVFGFFGVHTGFWFTKELSVRRQRRRARAAEEAEEDRDDSEARDDRTDDGA